jgi:translocation and assembly module TamB
MSHDAPPERSSAPTRRPLSARRVAAWAGGVLLALLLVAAALVGGANTRPGRAFLVEKLAAVRMASGLNVSIGRIDGSLYGRMQITDLQLRDAQGPFLTARRVVLDWRPLAYLHRKIDVRELSAPTVRLLRKPALKPGPPRDPNQPLLPDIDLTLGLLRIDRLEIEPAVTGKRHVASIRGKADLAEGRASLDAEVRALAGPGVAGGDRLTLALNATPKANRLQLDARLDAPLGGLLDSYANLGKPLNLSIGGRGDWAAWNGRAVGALGGQPLATLAITARNGDFTVKGPTYPALLAAPGAQPMLQPSVAVDIAARLQDRRVSGRATLGSDAFTVQAAGLADLGRNQFRDFRIDAELRRAGAVAKNLTARNARAKVVLNGPFARPRVAYDIAAEMVGFGDTTIEALHASGDARVDPDRILIPVKATARRIAGLNAAAGGLLTNIRIDGDLAVSGGRVMSDNLRLRSDRIDATAILFADLPAGRYNATLKGRVNDYQIDGLGRVDVVTDARLVSGKTGGFGMEGEIRATTRRLDNAALRDFLGGAAVVSADLSLDERGAIAVRGLRVAAPQFRLQGGGSYQPNGRISFRATADSSQYGPLTLVAGGTAQRPTARLTAARPNLGLQLRDVQIDLVGDGRSYKVLGKGGTPYGPFSADLSLRPGPRLAIDVAHFTLAGVTAKGGVTQTQAGPFAGALDLGGSGLSGTIRLGAEGEVQRADANLKAANARLPVEPAVTVGSGALRATAILYPGAPSVTAEARIGTLRRGGFLLESAQVRAKFKGAEGQVGLTARGESGVRFRVAAQASATANLVRANVSGDVNGVAVRLKAPAEARKLGEAWRLSPTTVILSDGELTLSGESGRTSRLQARLAKFDLAVLRPFAPDLGLEGEASGRIDATLPPNGATPNIDAQLEIARFSRVALGAASPPVDISLAGGLSGAGGQLQGVIRRGGVLGRLQARLAPVPAGGQPWNERLMAAPLSGGLRYSGPADVLWAMTGVAGQEVSGPIAIAADFSGRLSQPALSGVIRADALRYENPALGTVVSNIALRGRFNRNRFELTSLTGRAGRGSVSASGAIGLDAAGGFPIQLKATLANAQLARSDALSAAVTGTVSVTNSKERGALIEGDLTIPEARYQIVRQGAAEVAALEGVRRKGEVAPPPSPPPEGGLPTAWKLDLRVRADNRIFVQGMGLDAEWRADLRLGGTAAEPRVLGQLQVVRGSYSFAGRRLTLDTAEIRFDGATLTNPLLDIAASTTVEGVTAAINIGGRAQDPQITFSSVPALPQDEVLARLLFGSSIGKLSPTQAVQLAAALNSLRGGGGGLNPLGKLRSAAGVDQLRVLSADQSQGRGTAVGAGQYITDNIYLEVITDARGFTATQIEIALSKALSILSQAGSFGGSNVSLRYSKDY